MKIYLDNKEMEVEKSLTYLELSDKIYGEKIKTGVIAGNRFKYIRRKVQEGEHIKYIEKYCTDGKGIMERTILLVLILACKNLFPDDAIQVEHSIGDYIYCEFKKHRRLLHTDIEPIKKEMQRIIDYDFDIVRKIGSKEEALELFEKEGYTDKVLLFKNLDMDNVNYYEVNGRVFTFHGYLAPSTGYIDQFNIISYFPGVAVSVPTYKTEGEISNFDERKLLAKIFSNSKRWTELLNIEDVGSLNNYIKNNDIKYIIDTSEAYFENQISDIANNILNDDDINLIQIAGPSSSGKTTSAYRLSVQLGVRGKRPILISTDDYFVNREDTPVNEDGEKDYEMLEAIDLAKFNDDIMSLLEGKEIELPKFNFITGKREKSGNVIKLGKENILVIEGLHCLNPKLTKLVPEKNKYKIYISALTQLNIDDHNRISTSNVRLLRRMIRDSKFRGNSMETTLEEWPKVRRGEEKYIFPYQDLADVAIDSSLIYELSILKKHAFELFKNYGKTEKHYKEVKKLKSFLKYFYIIEDESLVPNNSILREIIG